MMCHALVLHGCKCGFVFSLQILKVIIQSGAILRVMNMFATKSFFCRGNWPLHHTTKRKNTLNPWAIKWAPKQNTTVRTLSCQNVILQDGSALLWFLNFFLKATRRGWREAQLTGVEHFSQKVLTKLWELLFWKSSCN